MELNLNPRSPESREARRQALRLIAARLEMAATERLEIYATEFDAAIDRIEAAGSEQERLHLALRVIDALAGYAWVLITLLKIEEMSKDLPEYLGWLRQQDEQTLLASVEHWFEVLASGESLDADADA